MRQSSRLISGITLGVLVLAASAANADDKPRNQVFFRGAWSYLLDDRGTAVFTDTAAASGANDKQNGYAVGAGLDLALSKPDQLGGNTLLGEIFVEYSRFSDQKVLPTTNFLLASTATRKVSVSELNVTIAPKLRLDSMGPVRPYIIPVGLSFLVNSPPSDNATYLDLGLHFAGGAEFLVTDQLSAGADLRFTKDLGHADTHTSYLTAGGYVGINF